MFLAIDVYKLKSAFTFPQYHLKFVTVDDAFLESGVSAVV